MLAMFFFFFYGEFILILDFLSFKKKTKIYLRIFFKMMLGILAFGALLKKYTSQNQRVREIWVEEEKIDGKCWIHSLCWKLNL